MIKKIITIVTTLIIIGSVNIIEANPISQKEALLAATNFYLVNNPTLSNVEIIDSKTINYDGINAISIFSFNTGGFVAISLFEETRPIVAYSFNGNLDLENIPDNVLAWYNNAGKRISELSKLDKRKIKKHNEWQLIETGNYLVNTQKSSILITSHWGQGCYFNQLCPAATNGPCGNCVTGCVATATAQIMYYWQYPQFGTGEHSYESTFFGPLSANFGETEYMWGDMTDDVLSENTAVATLMYHCGVSVDMAYTATSSGSNNIYALFALSNYFKYSNNIEEVRMSNYTTSEWIDLLKNEIDNLRPILYSGQFEIIIPEEDPIIDGHAWVCDGYDITDNFHFNWGYGDGSDGYYEMEDFLYPLNNKAIIKIMPIQDCDIKISEMPEPFSQTFTSESTIKVKVENYSLTPLTDIPISYSVNNGTIFNEEISETIPALSSIVYEFSTLYDFSTDPGFYSVEIFSSLICDTYNYNDTLTTTIQNITCAPIPYTTGFENDEERLGWLVEDANEDEKNWDFSYTGELNAFYQGNENNADDWLFSRCLELESGKLYKLSFDYKSTGMYWPQDLSINLGSAPQSITMLTELGSANGFINNAFEQKEIAFTVDQTDSYYLGFYCYSEPDMLNTVIDNVNIVELSQPDIEVYELLTPESSCELGDELIEIKIRNMCSNVLNDIPISYILDGEDAINETIETEIQPGEYANFQFSTLGDFSGAGDHTLKIFSSMIDDNNLINDTIEVVIQNQNASSTPYLCEFETSDEYEFYVIENLNDDDRTWQYLSSGGNENTGCVKYDYADFNAANDWLITKCLYLENEYIYKLSFWNKIEDASWPEKLEVKIGDAQIAGGMEVQLADYPNLTNSTYQLEEITFPISSDGYYYIGFHCYSDAQMFNLYLDDISIDIDEINDISDIDNRNLEIFPNPSNDIIYLRTENEDYNNSTICIYNLQGKKIIETTMSEDEITIDISSLDKGIYLVKAEGSISVFVKRIIKI